MPDIFWLGGFSLHGDFLAGLRSLGLKSEWVQEAHLLGEAPELPVTAAYHWPGQVSSAHRLLHFTSQALQSADLDLLLLADVDQVTALASPQAIGRWNLNPRANLCERFSYSPQLLPEQFLPMLAVHMLVAEIDPEQSGCASSLEQARFELAPAFPTIEWLEGLGSGLVSQLNQLCTALEERSSTLGLLFSPGLATVIERV
jgi:hypothetical protein